MKMWWREKDRLSSFSKKVGKVWSKGNGAIVDA